MSRVVVARRAFGRKASGEFVGRFRAGSAPGPSWTPDDLSWMGASVTALWADPLTASYKDATPSDTPTEPAETGDLVSTIVSESTVMSGVTRLSTLRQGTSGIRLVKRSDGNLFSPSGSGDKLLGRSIVGGNTFDGLTIAAFMTPGASGAVTLRMDDPASAGTILTGVVLSGGSLLVRAGSSTNITVLASGFPSAGAAVIFTMDSTGYFVYVDGVLQASGATVTNIVNDGMAINIPAASADRSLGRFLLAAQQVTTDSADIASLTSWLARA